MTSEGRDPHSPVGLVHEGWGHLRLQRPLAAWASWQQALRVSPEDRAATEALALLDSADELPPIARLGHRFRSPAEPVRRERWSSAFAGRDLGDLGAAAHVFAEIADADPGDSAALHNLGLCAAWRGENWAAIDALDLSVGIDAAENPDAAVASWMIAEILRQGAGAEPLSDDLSHFLVIEWPEELGDALGRIAEFAALRELPNPMPSQVAGSVTTASRIAEWLDRPPSRGGIASRVVATLIVLNESLRLTSPDRDSLELAESVLATRLGDRFRPTDRGSTPLPIRLMDAAAWVMRLPRTVGETDLGTESAARRAAVEESYEQIWIIRPRLGLGVEGRPRSPAESARDSANGDAVARVKLAAAVNLREQLASRPRMAAIVDGYPFDRLRRRLGLPLRDEASVEAADFTSMGCAELAGLDPASLGDDDLIEASGAAVAVCDEAALARFSEAKAARGLAG